MQENTQKFHPRIDAIERVSGRAKYASDWKIPGMLYGAIIRSTIPHGIVKNVDKSKALAISGVKGIITCLDSDIIWNAGEREHQRKALPTHVRFFGECIGAVAAETRNIARQAAELVAFEYEELPASYSIRESITNGSLKIWDNGNVLGPMGPSFGKIEDIFSNPDLLILEREYKTSRVHGSPLECSASLAWWENKDTDRLNIVAATQSIFGCRDGIARDLGLRPEQVRVIAKFKGGGFGNKNNSMNYDLISALLSKRTGKPVMVEFSREEDLTGVHCRWSTEQKLKVAVDVRAGKLTGVELKAHCDLGAYTRAIKQSRLIEGPDSYYSYDAWISEVYGVYTNTPATGHVRAPTGPQSCFSLETLVDEVAHQIHVDPVEFRRANLVKIVHGEKTLTSNGFEECLNLGAEAFRWKEKRQRSTDSSGTIQRGAGVAIATWHAFVGRGEAIVNLHDNGRVELFTGVVDIGTGAKSIMAMIAAETLGIEVESVDSVWGDTSVCPYSIGESGGRTTSFTGSAVRMASSLVRNRLCELVSNYYGAHVEDVSIERGRVTLKNKPEIGKIEISQILQQAGVKKISEKAVSEPALSDSEERLAFAAHFAEVEVDTETGIVNVESYVAAHESGPIVNRLMSESQVKGGVVMGIGMALSEKLIIDQGYGTVQNSSFMSYKLPNGTSIPEVEVLLVEKEDPYGPKSLGEIPIVPVPAAIGNAIFNATGARLREIPFNQELVLTSIDLLNS